ATHRRPPMRATIGEEMYRTLVIASQHHGLKTDPPGDELARPGHLALVTHKNPTPVMDTLHLLLQDRGVDIQPPRHPILSDQPVVEAQSNTSVLTAVVGHKSS